MDKLVLIGMGLIYLLVLTWPKEAVDPSDCVYRHGARVVEC